MNARREPQRSGRFPSGRARAELYPRRREARRVAIGAEPDHPRPRGAARPSPFEPHHAQRRAEAGERLLRTIGPHIGEIETELEALSALREKPAGAIRITAGDHAIHSVLWPKLAKFLPNYPDIKVEIAIDYGLTDIVAERYDAGVRLGEQVSRDMIAVRIGPDVRFAVVGARSYFAKRPPPAAPQDLVGHNCINLRLPTYGGLYAWEFEKDGRDVRVRVEGQLVFSSVFQALDAALAGLGLGYVPEDLAEAHLAD